MALVAVGPFGAEPAVFYLHHDPRAIAMGLAGLARRIDCVVDRLALRIVGAIVIVAEPDLPFSIMRHDIEDDPGHLLLPLDHASVQGRGHAICAYSWERQEAGAVAGDTRADFLHRPRVHDDGP